MMGSSLAGGSLLSGNGSALKKATVPPFQSRILDGIPLLWSRSPNGTPSGGGSLSTAGDPGGTSSVSFVTPYAMQDFRAIFANESNAAAGPALPANAVTFTAVLEYPLGTFFPLTFGGQATCTLGPNGIAKSDPIALAVPAGTKIGVRTYVQVATPPVAVTAATATTGGTLAAASYYYKVVADCGPQGLSGPSAEVSVTTTGSTSANTLTWVSDPLSVAPIGYLIYRGTAAGAETLLGAVPATKAQGVNTWVDTGAIAAPAAWSASGTYASGARATSGGNVYVARVGGTGSTVAPTGTSTFSDGTVRWVYVGASTPPAPQKYPINCTVNCAGHAPNEGVNMQQYTGGDGGNYLSRPTVFEWNLNGVLAYAFGPFAIIATPQQGFDVPVVAIFGDSISVGYSQYNTNVASDQGYIALALQNANIPYWLLGKSGELISTGLDADNRNRLMFAGAATDAICEYGINDLYLGSVSVAALQAAYLQAWQAMQARGSRVWQTTLLPFTGSTDQFATVANQTVSVIEANRVAINTWIRAGAPVTISGNVITAAAVGTSGAIVAGQTGHPLSGIFDPAALLEVNSAGVVTLNGGFWPANGTIKFYTPDGTHPTDASVRLITSAIATSNFQPP